MFKINVNINAVLASPG